jgi:hypothetical protein
MNPIFMAGGLPVRRRGELRRASVRFFSFEAVERSKLIVVALIALGALTPTAQATESSDHLPGCEANTYFIDGYMPIPSRPGATRRFSIRCEDADSDPFEPRLSTPPKRGVIDPFGATPTVFAGWSSWRWIEATYTPSGDSMEPDPFTITASGPHGDGPPLRAAIVPRPYSENGGGGCGQQYPDIRSDQAGVVTLTCEDTEGDPLSAEVVTDPKHGTAESPVVTDGADGRSHIAVPYTPDHGYDGYDSLKVKVQDEYGFQVDLVVDILVRWPYSPWPDDLGTSLPPLPPSPSLPPLPPAAPSTTRAEAISSLAEQALGTTHVKRVKSSDGAQVWARSQLSRAELLRSGQAPGVVVVCLRACQVRADSALSTGRRRSKTAASRTPGESELVSVTLTRGERAALRRARKPRAVFNLNVRPAGGAATVVRRSIRVGR